MLRQRVFFFTRILGAYQNSVFFLNFTYQSVYLFSPEFQGHTKIKGVFKFHILECTSFFTRILGAYQNSGVFKFHILECVSFSIRILGAYKNSGVFKFHILECISFFTRILGTYQNSGVFKFHTGMYIDKYIHATKYPWIVGFLKLISIRILGYLSSFGYFDN